MVGFESIYIDMDAPSVDFDVAKRCPGISGRLRGSRTDLLPDSPAPGSKVFQRRVILTPRST